MSEKEKKKALWVDENTHMEVAIMAARRKVSIGKCLKEMVEEEKINPFVRVERTVAGPNLYIGSVLVRSWLGTDHNEDADCLAREIGSKK